MTGAALGSSTQRLVAEFLRSRRPSGRRPRGGEGSSPVVAVRARAAYARGRLHARAKRRARPRRHPSTTTGRAFRTKCASNEDFTRASHARARAAMFRPIAHRAGGAGCQSVPAATAWTLLDASARAPRARRARDRFAPPSPSMADRGAPPPSAASAKFRRRKRSRGSSLTRTVFSAGSPTSFRRPSRTDPHSHFDSGTSGRRRGRTPRTPHLRRAFRCHRALRNRAPSSRANGVRLSLQFARTPRSLSSEDGSAAAAASRDTETFFGCGAGAPISRLSGPGGWRLRGVRRGPSSRGERDRANLASGAPLCAAGGPRRERESSRSFIAFTSSAILASRLSSGPCERPRALPVPRTFLVQLEASVPDLQLRELLLPDPQPRGAVGSV